MATEWYPVYGTQTFVPGQIWTGLAHTSELDGSDNKFRPYMVLCANNKRLILIRMTTGGERSTNWLFTLNMGDKKQNFICDLPITVDINKFECPTYRYQLTPDLFRTIASKCFASMIYQAFGGPLESSDYDVINTIIEGHDDEYHSFSIYYSLFSDWKPSTCDDEDAEEDDIEEEEETIEPEAEVDDNPITPVKIEKPTIESRLGTRSTKPKFEDLFIYEGFTSEQDFYDTCFNKFHIISGAARTMISAAVAEGRCTHENGSYGLTFKCRLTAAKYKQQIYNDTINYTDGVVADIWDKTRNYIYLIKSEVRKELIDGNLKSPN